MCALEISSEKLTAVFQFAVDQATRVTVLVANIADRPELIIAFLAGALALLTGARLTLVAAALAASVWAAQEMGLVVLDAKELELIASGVAALFLIGMLQGIVTLLAGEQAAGTSILIILFGLVAFFIWRGPGWLLGLLLRRR
jgi:hypothetical protein